MGYVAYQVFSRKEMLKMYKELVDLHKRCIKSYLVSKSLKYSARQKFFHIYDHFIDENNIIRYFHLPVKYFVYSIIKYELKNLDNAPDKKSLRKFQRRKSRQIKHPSRKVSF